MNKSTQPVVRHATPKDLDGIYGLVDKTLYHPSEMIMARYRNYPGAKPGHSVVVEVDGKIVSHIRLYPCDLYYGDICVKAVSIGDVCTDPEYRKRGFGALCLNQATEWMRENDAVISLIYSGVLGFYKSAGWVDVPMEVLSIPIDSLGDVAAKQDEIIVRRFERANDLEGVANVYAQYSKGRFLSAVRGELWWRNSFHWITDENEEAFYVAERDGEITGYGRMNGNSVKEICYTDFDSGLALWRGIAKWAKRWHLWGDTKPYKAVLLRIPENERLFEYLKQYEGAEKQSGACGLLIRYVDMPQLIKALSPELVKRTLNDFDFVFEIDGQRFSLSRCAGGVKAEQTDAPADISVDYDEFVRRLAGRVEKRIATGMDDKVQIMETLFPQFVQSVWPVNLA